MKPERLAELDTLLERLLDLSPEQRLRRLAGIGARDAQLRRTLEELLRGEVPDAPLTEDLLSSPLVQAFGEELASTELGRTVGSFRIIGELGRGGMADVFEAVRVDAEFEQRVALKLLHNDTRAPRQLERFGRERQAMASLEHPNITRLIDGGLTEDGRPYLAMELVGGKPIDRHCNDRHLDVEARLRLWLEVATAVEHAHRNLVVHRDLKPSNVLVTDDGRVKLLDFGIATLLDGAEGTAQTGTELETMTPRYAAPEQLLAKPVTTATDVYQLGLLLYELLVGQSPYRLRGAGRTEVERAILEQDPLPPSSRAKPAGQTGRRRRLLRGDLDAILLKALRKDPRQRYGSAAEMREDVERHLSGAPVIARRGSTLYRARRFALRERATLSMICAAALLLAGTVAALVLFYTERLRRERDQAQEVTEFLQELFQASDPERARGEEVTARELLARGADRIEAELTTQPEVKARMMTLLGDVHQRLGLYKRSESLLKEALNLSLEVFGNDHPQVATTYNKLGNLYLNSGQLAEAESHHRRALEIRRQRLGRDHLDVAASLHNLALVHVQQARYGDAEASFQRALAILDRTLGNDHPQAASYLGGLASLYAVQGRHSEAEPLLRRALEATEGRLGSDHPDVGTRLHTLAALQLMQGRPVEAEPLLERALGILEGRLGPQHPRVAMANETLAIAYAEQGRLSKAEPHFERAHQIREQSLGLEHPDVARSLATLGNLYLEQGKSSAAEAVLQRALEILEKTLAPDHPALAVTLEVLGVVYARTGEYQKAEALINRALSIRERGLGDEHPLTAQALSSLAEAPAAQGRFGEAQRLLERALSIYGDRGATGQSAGISRRLALLHLHQGDPGNAAVLFDRAVALLASAGGGEGAALAEALRDQAILQIHREELVAAEALLRRSLEIHAARRGVREPTFGEDQAEAATLLVAGELQRRLGREERANELCERALAAIEPLAQASDFTAALDTYAKSLYCLGRPRLAAPIVRRLLAKGWRDPHLAQLAGDLPEV